MKVVAVLVHVERLVREHLRRLRIEEDLRAVVLDDLVALARRRGQVEVERGVAVSSPDAVIRRPASGPTSSTIPLMTSLACSVSDSIARPFVAWMSQTYPREQASNDGRRAAGEFEQQVGRVGELAQPAAQC